MAWPICLGQLRTCATGYFDRVAAGETIDIIRRGKLVARIVPAFSDQPDRRQVSRIAEPWIRLGQLRKHAARYLDRVAAGDDRDHSRWRVGGTYRVGGRHRLILTRAHGDEAAYRDYRDRYRAMATSLGFEGHIAWAEAMP